MNAHPMLEWLATQVGQAKEHAWDAAQNIYQGAAGAVEEAGGVVRDVTEDVFDGAHSASDWADDVTLRAQEALGLEANPVANRIRDTNREMREQTLDWTEDKVDGIQDWAGARATEADEWIEQTAAQARAVSRQMDENAQRAGRAIDIAVSRRARTAARSAADAVSGPGGRFHTGVQRDVDKIRDIAERFGLGNVDESSARCEDCDHDGGLMVFEPNEEGIFKCTEVTGGSLRENIDAARDRAYLSNSECCEARRRASPEKTKTIFYTNGILTDCETHTRTLKKIADITCGLVIGIYNSTEAYGLADIAHTGSARQFLREERAGALPMSYQSFSPSVKTIQNVMTSELVEQGEFSMFAHSEGGANTSLATFRGANELRSLGMGGLVDNTYIISMGSAAREWADGPRYEHFIHVNDTTPNLMGLGDSNRRSGADARVRRFDGDRHEGFTHEPAKRPWFPHSAQAAHNIDDSYLEYYDQVHGGCGNEE